MKNKFSPGNNKLSIIVFLLWCLTLFCWWKKAYPESLMLLGAKVSLTTILLLWLSFLGIYFGEVFCNKNRNQWISLAASFLALLCFNGILITTESANFGVGVLGILALAILFLFREIRNRKTKNQLGKTKAGKIGM